MDTDIFNTIIRKFQSYESRLYKLSVPRLVIELNLIFFATKMVLGIVLALIYPIIPLPELQPSLEELLNPRFIVVVLLIAPVMETILFQYAIIETMLILTGKKWPAIITSTVVFAWLHGFPESLVILPGAFIFAYLYYMQRSISHLRAIGVVTLVHMLHNLLAWGVGVLTEYFVG